MSISCKELIENIEEKFGGTRIVGIQVTCPMCGSDNVAACRDVMCHKSLGQSPDGEAKSIFVDVKNIQCLDCGRELFISLPIITDKPVNEMTTQEIWDAIKGE